MISERLIKTRENAEETGSICPGRIPNGPGLDSSSTDRMKIRPGPKEVDVRTPVNVHLRLNLVLGSLVASPIHSGTL